MYVKFHGHPVHYPLRLIPGIRAATLQKYGLTTS